jgi:DNA-binding LacI/PurR family transcriptional regulator
MSEATRELVRQVIKDLDYHLSTHRAVTESPG